MKAFLSGPNVFGTSNDYCRHTATERAYPQLASNASATEAWAQCKGALALAELAKILAETEAGFLPGTYYQCCPDTLPQIVLRDALTALTADGGPLDSLAEVGVIGQLSAIAHRNANVEVWA